MIAASDESRALCEDLESRTLFAVSLNSQGWTVVTPSADSRIIYVSTSGSDTNNGLSPSAPVASVAQARTLVRSGFPDQILLRRGDTFFGGGLAQWNLSGRNADEPFVLGAYTDPAAPSTQRPKLATGIATGFLASGATQNANVYIMGVAFEAHLRNYREPQTNFTTGYREEVQNGTNGLRIVGPFDNLLVEDCSFQYYRINVNLQTTVVSGVTRQVSNVRLRRNIIADAYAPNVDQNGVTQDTTAIGVYADGVQNLTMDGNVLSHNGWADDNALGAVQSIYNHNAYINTGNSGFVFTNNISADAGSHGLQARAGGIIKNNLFLRNPIAMSYGYVNGSVKAGGVFGEISDNVVIGSSRILDATRGWGLELSNLRATSQGGGTVVRNNIFSNDLATNDQWAIKLDIGSVNNVSQDVGINDLRLENNVVYSWARGLFIHPGFNDPANSNYRPLTGLVVNGNDFQRLNAASGQIISHLNPFVPSAETWSVNRYDGMNVDSSGSRWFRVGATQMTFDQFQAGFEPTAIRAMGIFPDAGRDAGKYNSTLGGSNSTDAFMTQALRQSRQYWRTNYTSGKANEYIREGFAGGRVDTAAPTASLDVDGISVAGDLFQNFTITWADDNKLDATTIGDGDVRVTGPNGYSAIATLVTTSGNNASDRRTATYRVAAPSGGWSASANGVYTILVEPNQVRDILAKPAAAVAVGQFSVAIAPTTPSAVATAPNLITDTAPATVTVTYTGAVNPPLPVIVTPLNAGFESPNVGDAFIYNPVGGEWTFEGYSGVSANNSGFTALNPVAPQGAQVAFLQNTSRVYQTLTGLQAGSYAVSLKMAQRNGQPAANVIRVLLNGQLAGEFTPGSTDYQTFTTNALTLPAGSATLELITTNPSGLDTTIFVDDVQVLGTIPGTQQLISAASLDAGDIRITGPNGFVATATSAVVSDPTDGAVRTVTYTVPAPAGGWSDAGISTLAIQAVANQVTAVGGTAVPAGRIGSIGVAVNGPAAQVTASDVPPTLVGTHTFQVSYSSVNGVVTTSIDSADLRVLGPSGYNQPATLVSFFGDGTTASPIVATYTIPEPATGWAVGSNGVYAIVAQANQITDTTGNALVAGQIGQFSVNVDRASPLASTQTSAITSSTNTSRTVFVNYYDVSGINHATLDSNDLIVTGPNGFSATLVRSGTITQRGLSLKVPYVLSAPAGGWKSRMNGTYTITLQAGQVADNVGLSATAARAIGSFDVALETVPPTVSITAVSPTPRNSAVSSMTLTYSEQTFGFDLADLTLTRDGVNVPLTGATLTLTKASTTGDPTEVWTLGNLSGLTSTAGTYVLTDAAGGVEDPAGNVQAVPASQSWVVDLTPPVASNATATSIITVGGVATISVTYSDAIGLNAASIDSNDLLISGPNGYNALANLQSVTGTGNTRTATYIAPAPAGGWKSSANGAYSVSLLPGQIADTAGNTHAGGPLTSFSVSLEATPPTATFSALQPSTRLDPVTSVTLTFSEVVTGFDASDLTLVRDGSTVSLAGISISAGAGNAYTINGLASATTPPGSYTLTLASASSGIVDSAGNLLSSGTSLSFVILPPPQLGASLADGGFETPVVGSGTWGAFATAPTGTAWTFESTAGISGNGSGFTAGNPNAPQGAQVAYIQIAGAMRQSFNVTTSGSYQLRFLAAQRGNFQTDYLDFQVWADDQLLGTYIPTGTNYQTIITPSFTLSQGVHTIRFVGICSTHGDNTVFLDDIRLEAGPDTTAPTAAFDSVVPNPTTAPVTQAIVNFSEPVFGIDQSDFSLTRNGAPVSLAGLSLSTTDGKSYTVSGLTTATTPVGNYTLTINSGGVFDLAGNPTTAPASVSWSTVLPAPQITSVSPAVVAGSAFAQTLTIDGVNFAANSTVVIRNALTGEVMPGVTTVGITATQAFVSAVFNVAGSWTAEVTGNNGTSAAVGFTSTAPTPLTVDATVAPTGLTAAVVASGAPSGTTVTWSVTSAPAGAPTVQFSENRTATASSATATFGAAGTYTLQAVASDGVASTSGSVTVTIAQVLSALNVTPGSASIAASATQQFAADGVDQFNAPMIPPNLAWEVYSGGGTITAGGLYTAPAASTSAVVRAISGTWIKSAIVTVAAPTTFNAVKIDFVPAAAPVASGYQRDGGSTFANRGNGYTYGWSVSHTDAAVDRNKNSNQLLDANIGIKNGARWQLQVPNGRYVVRVGVGDASVATTNTVRVEGTTLYSAVAQAANVFSTRTIVATVSDGVLTIDAGSAASLATRLTHIEVSPWTVTTAKIDFSTSSATLASGYQRDSGNTYADRGNGLIYGWNVSHTANVFDRNKASTQLVDTVLLAKSNAIWEMAVPNGTYSVTVGIGDGAAASTNTVRLEGGSVFTSTALAANKFSTKTVTVNVSDGKLTLQVGSADLATRLTHLDIVKV